LYLENNAVAVAAKLEQEKRGEVDEWTEPVRNILAGDVFPRKGFPMVELAKRLEQFGAHKLDKVDQMRLGRILKQLGFVKFQEQTGHRRKLWKATPAFRANHLEPPGTTIGGSTKSSMIQDFY
jgi:hypothetical protein